MALANPEQVAIRQALACPSRVASHKRSQEPARSRASDWAPFAPVAVAVGLAQFAHRIPARSRRQLRRRSVSSERMEGAGTLGSCKRDLLYFAAAGNRGFSASDADRKRAAELVDALALEFKAARDLNMRRDLLRGRWKLVYTSSPDLTSLENLPLPGWQTGRVGQSFLTASFAKNEIDFCSPFGSKVTQEVNCTWKVVTPMDDAFLVELVFRYSSTRLAEMAGLQLPAPALNLPLPPGAGIFEVAFVDEDLLVQRTRFGNGRNAFNVLLKETS
ncbi:Thop1 [Symbiodinium natans]|uniref:Thop1 protein n=1 Tax=Symbiodinium natans TaxID=878477 RepID=A0A812RQI9_9DINO|nr:Thop1 [Symbiodinium natans]